MKKLLVLALVVSMLAVTGSAFAKAIYDDAGHLVGHTDSNATFDTSTLTSSDITSNALPSGSAYAASADAIVAAFKAEGTITGVDQATALAMFKSITTVAEALFKSAVATVSNTNLVPSGVTAISSANVSLPAPEMLVAAVKLQATSTEELTTPKVFPTITRSSLTNGSKYAFTLFNGGTDDKVASGQKYFRFFNGKSSIATSSRNIYVTYAATTTAAASSSIYADTDISGSSYSALRSVCYATLQFVYSTSAGVADDDGLTLMVANTTGTTEANKAAGGSGGGCVAGTSAAALALAVLGFVAKRRA